MGLLDPNFLCRSKQLFSSTIFFVLPWGHWPQIVDLRALSFFYIFFCILEFLLYLDYWRV